MRRAIFAAALFAASGATASPPSENPKLTAYRYAVRCFYANGHMVGALKRSGQADRAAAFYDNAERSHRGAVTLGRAAGLSDAQMARDLDSSQSGFDLARMVTDAEYFDQVVATCKAIGLM